MHELTVNGSCDPQFDVVQEAFAANWAEFPEVGAAVSVAHRGRPVVDIWAGWADAARQQPWASDTVVLVASVSKAIIGLCGNLLIDRGLLDPDRPAAEYWPKFARNGKADVPVGAFFDHTAGLPDDFPGVDLTDWRAVITHLEDASPKWPARAAHSYHTHNMGFLIGELILRVTGESPNAFLSREVTGPLGVDAWFGLPRRNVGRRAEIVAPVGSELLATTYNSMPWQKAEIPAANMHTNARALCRVFDVLGANFANREHDGIRLAASRTLREATETWVTGPWFGADLDGPENPFLPRAVFASRFARGFILSNDWAWFGPNPGAFGGHGVTGAIAFADPDADLSFAYTTNTFVGFDASRDSRSGRIVDALYTRL